MEAFLPAPNAGLRFTGLPHDLVGADPAADRRTIWARHTCFWGLLRFAATAFRWRRMAGVTVRDIPVRIQQIHMLRPNSNPLPEFKCQNSPTSADRSNQGGDDGDITLRPQPANLLADR